MKNTYGIDGEIAKILLPRKDGTSLVMLIDALDLGVALDAPGTIYASWNPKSQRFYASFHASIDQKQRTFYFHHLLLPCTDRLEVDHLNHDGLDNRRANLRLATGTENLLNRRRLMTRNTSGARGVFRHRDKWRAQIGFHGKIISLGVFSTRGEAKVAYDTKLAQLDPLACQS